MLCLQPLPGDDLRNLKPLTKENPTPWSHLYGFLFFIFESYLKYKNICRGKVLGVRFSCSSRKNLHNHSTSRLRISIRWFYLWRLSRQGWEKVSQREGQSPWPTPGVSPEPAFPWLCACTPLSLNVVVHHKWKEENDRTRRTHVGHINSSLLGIL